MSTPGTWLHPPLYRLELRKTEPSAMPEIPAPAPIPPTSKTLDAARHLAPYVHSLIGQSAQEHFVALYMTATGSLIGAQILGIGTHSEVRVDVPTLCVSARMAGAFAVVVAHNHPGTAAGELRFSIGDVRTTGAIAELCSKLDLHFADHILVCSDGWRSLSHDMHSGYGGSLPRLAAAIQAKAPGYPSVPEAFKL